jgi:hypothetical protein
MTIGEAQLVHKCRAPPQVLRLTRVMNTKKANRSYSPCFCSIGADKKPGTNLIGENGRDKVD